MLCGLSQTNDMDSARCTDLICSRFEATQLWETLRCFTTLRRDQSTRSSPFLYQSHHSIFVAFFRNDDGNTLAWGTGLPKTWFFFRDFWSAVFDHRPTHRRDQRDAGHLSCYLDYDWRVPLFMAAQSLTLFDTVKALRSWQFEKRCVLACNFYLAATACCFECRFCSGTVKGATLLCFVLVLF